MTYLRSRALGIVALSAVFGGFFGNFLADYAADGTPVGSV